MSDTDDRSERDALAELFQDVRRDPSTFEPSDEEGDAEASPPVFDEPPPRPSAEDEGGGLMSLAELDALLEPVGKIVVRRREPGATPPASEGRAEGASTTAAASAASTAGAEDERDDEREDERAGGHGGGDDGGEGDDDVLVAPGWREEHSTWWKWGFPVTMLVLVVLVPLLVYVGYRTVLESNDSVAVRAEKSEDEPGWEALVEPTPTMVVGFTDDEGELAGVSVLSLTGESASGVVVMHPGTVGPIPGTEENTVAELAFAENGAEGLQDMIGATLNVGMGEVAVLDPEQLAALLEPVGPLAVDNDDVVTTPDTRFDRGALDLAPADVAAYLNTRNEVEDDQNRMDRYVTFWEAWLSAIAADGTEGAVPGETDSGLGYFLRQMAGGQHEISTLPVQPSGVPNGGPTDKVYVPLHPETEQLMVALVPFPVGAPPGARVRIRLLDGTGELDHGLPASAVLVFEGGEISAIGNAASFDYTTTQIIYADDIMEPSAQAMRDALGVGEVVASDAQGDTVDLIVILGTDWAALPVAEQNRSITEGTIVGTSIRPTDDGG